MCLPTFYRNIKFTGMIYVMKELDEIEEVDVGEVKRRMAEEELREVKVVVIIINVVAVRGKEETAERVKKRVEKEMEEESNVIVEVCNV